MNVKLLRKVAKHISKEPRRFVMGSWVLRGDREVIEMLQVKGIDRWPMPKCGTAGCIAGWACLFTGNENPDSYEVTGARVLGINGEQACALFSVHQWPAKMRERFMAAKTPKTRTKIAVARIERFIKTKGAE